MPSTQSHFKKLSFGSSGPEISKKKIWKFSGPAEF